LDIVPYQSNPVARAIETRDRRAFARELAAVKRPAQLAQSRITAIAEASATAQQAVAALSRLEANLSSDEVVAQRLGRIMNVTTTVLEFELAALHFRR
jgi:hypothetical protein